MRAAALAARLRGALAAATMLLAGCMPAAEAPPAAPPAPVAQHAPAESATGSTDASATAAQRDAGNSPRVSDDVLSADEVRLAQLPREARETLQRIRSGGPFPYERDGSVFGNREGHLPKRPRGYYTEYTVRTPGARDRGARRIVAGRGATGNAATGGEYYYTDDHYDSFRRIRE